MSHNFFYVIGRSLKTDGLEEFQPLRFTGFKASQQKDGTMNQVVRALETFLNQKASTKRADKMQYTRMGKRGGDVDSSFPSYKRDVMDKMQYTRMGKRAGDMEDGMEWEDLRKEVAFGWRVKIVLLN